MMNFIEIAARGKLKQVPEWSIYRWERINNDFIVEGAVDGFFEATGGNGDSVLSKPPLEKCVVTKQEVDKEKIKFEKKSGLCSECIGQGQVLAGWDNKIGNTYKACLKCCGTGFAVKEKDKTMGEK